MKQLLRNFIIALILFGAGLAQSQAQSTSTAIIKGTLQTEAGRKLLGANISVLHLPTGIRKVGTSDQQGQFMLDYLLPGGPYYVQIKQPGFRSQVINDVFLKAGETTSLTIAMVADVVAVGTRRTDRGADATTGPVDVFDVRELLLTNPSADLTQVLHYNVASLNSTRQSTADGTDHVDPSSLRGLAPDQMLVLMNGKRQHTTALINLLGNRGVGSVGYDLNAFSVNALDRVEVLRDGAAAQYGSDAIAGVMNLTLKSANRGGSVLASSGLHSYGDGLMTTLSLNKGLKLGEKGFLNATIEADYHGATVRHYSRDLASWPVYSSDQAEEDAFLQANNRTYADYVQRNGNARITNYRGALNLGYRLSERSRLYAFATLNQRFGNSATLWRLPNDTLKLNAVTKLGYQPEISTTLLDASVVAGANLGLGGGWSLDLSQTVGTNRMSYQVDNTLNASQGRNSLRSFNAGRLQFWQGVTNATATRLFPTLLAGTNVAVGGEFRREQYDITPGDKASYTAYQDAPGYEPGSQGFFGFSDLAGSQKGRTIGAGFLDLEADIVKSWTVSVAARYENYSSFGDKTIFKVNTRVQVARNLALRAGYNSGFRAPSLQQENYQQITVLPTQNDTRYGGIFSSTSAAAEAAGLNNLKAETSDNYSAGLVLTPTSGLTFSADAYVITVADRILLSSALQRDAVQDPKFAGALRAINADQAQFFVNAANTRTQGLDLVGSFTRPAGRGELRLRLAANFAKHEVTLKDQPKVFERVGGANLGNQFINQRQLSQLETGTPNAKVHAQLGYSLSKVSVLARATYFGEVAYYDYNYEGLTEGSYYMVFKPKATIDLALTVQPTKTLTFTAGGNNIFNALPNTKREAAMNGDSRNTAIKALHDGYNSYLPYDRDIIPYEPVQMGFNGAFFYLKVGYGIGL